MGGKNSGFTIDKVTLADFSEPSCLPLPLFSSLLSLLSFLLLDSLKCKVENWNSYGSWVQVIGVISVCGLERAYSSFSLFRALV